MIYIYVLGALALLTILFFEHTPEERDERWWHCAITYAIGWPFFLIGSFCSRLGDKLK